MQLEQHAQEKLLRNGPMPKRQFMQLLEKLASTLHLKCSLSDITFQNIDLTGTMVTHAADKVVSIIRDHIELVDIADIIKEHGKGMSFTLFQTHLQTHQRLCSGIFIVSKGPRWFGRKRSRMNIYDSQSLLRHVRTAGCAGVSVLDLASEYQGCGRALLDFISMNAMVQVGNRIYCVTVAKPRIEGALQAWNGGHSENWRPQPH